MMPSVIATRWEKKRRQDRQKTAVEHCFAYWSICGAPTVFTKYLCSGWKAKQSKNKKIHGKNMGMMVKYKEYVCITNTQVIITWFRVGMQRGAKERKHRKSTFTWKSTTKWQGKKQIYQAKYKTVIKQSSGFWMREREREWDVENIWSKIKRNTILLWWQIPNNGEAYAAVAVTA